jgi:hypothetical protein
VLVLLMGVIYEVRSMKYEVHNWDYLRWHNIRTKFHEDMFGNSGNIKVFPSTIWEVIVLVFLMGSFCDVCRWVDLTYHDTHVASFMTIGLGIPSSVKGITSTIWEAIVLVLLMRGIYDIRHLEGLRWQNCTYQVSWRLVQAFKQY